MPSEPLRLKFKNPLPFMVENDLIAKGWVVHERRPNEYVMFEKPAKKLKPIVQTPIPVNLNGGPGVLAEYEVTDLTRRLNAIVDCFEDPDTNKELIRVRCMCIAQGLRPTAHNWVMNWIRTNIDEDESPWED